MGAIGLSGLVGAAAVPIAVLAALAKDRWDACDTARLRRAQKAALAALDRQDITEAEIATARRLLKEARGTLRIAPEAAVDPIRNGTLVEDLTRSVFGDRLSGETPGTVLAVQTVLATLFEDFRTDATYRAAFTEAAVIRVLKQNDVAFDLLSAIKSDTAELKAMVAALSRRIGVDEALSEEAREMARREELVLHLAQTYAKGNPGDFDGALRGIENALEVAAANRAPSGATEDAALSPVLAHVDALNDAGRSEEATDALRATLDDLREEAALLERRRLLVIDKALVQAVIDRDVNTAVALEREKARLTDPDDLYTGMQTAYTGWMTRGVNQNLRFDLEVALGLAREQIPLARSALDLGHAHAHKGRALMRMGQASGDIVQFEEAADAYREALYLLKLAPEIEDWAEAQTEFAWALKMRADLETGTERLEEAGIQLMEVIDKWPPDGAPAPRLRALDALGGTLRMLGERSEGTHWLKEAVKVCGDTVKEQSRADQPVDWALAQMRYGNALLALGKREGGTARLTEGRAAYQQALEALITADRPNHGAMLRGNLSELEIAAFDATGDMSHLKQAEAHARAALEFFQAGDAVFYRDWVASLVTDIENRRTKPSPTKWWTFSRQ